MTQRMHRCSKVLLSTAVLAVTAALPAAGCRDARHHRAAADAAAGGIIAEKQRQAVGRTEPFAIERPADTLRRRLLLDQDLPRAGPASLGVRALDPIDHWPSDDYLRTAGRPDGNAPTPDPGTIRLGLVDALRVAARNSNPYQDRKEAVYLTALNLDLERDAFRATFAGLVDADATADWSTDELVSGGVATPTVGVGQRFKSGLAVTTRLALDLVQLLTPNRASSAGLISDTTITLPLLRGAGRHIVAEPLTQAERDVVYAILSFEQFKREFVVDVATRYLEVIQLLDEVRNTEDGYRRVVLAGRRSRRLASSGRLPEIQVDQAVQQELRARADWVEARQDYAAAVDEFKGLLGLPPDARIELDPGELERLADAAQAVLKAAPDAGPTTAPATRPATGPAGTMPTMRDVAIEPPGAGGAGPYELPELTAIRLALAHRPDLRVSLGQVTDAQRRVVVAADALRPGLDVVVGGTFGGRRGLDSAAEPFAGLRPERGTYTLSAPLELPLERTAERNRYRESLVELERATRELQEREDEIKRSVRGDLRDLLAAREGVVTQVRAVAVARRRVAATDMLLQAGRVEIRDVLEAQEDLVEAQNEFTTALVEYRSAELGLQRDIGLLEVNHEGLWREYQPPPPGATQ